MSDTSQLIFKIVDNELVVLSVDALMTPSFVQLKRRLRPMPGDTDGRNKLLNNIELKYVYLIADYESYPNLNGFTDKEAHDHAVSILQPPHKWMPDALVKQAIEDYRNLQSDVSRETIQELLKVFHNNTRIVRAIRSNIDNVLSNESVSKEDIKELISYQKTLIEIATEIPNQTAKLQSTLDTLKHTNKRDQYKLMRGSEEEPPDSADPSRSYA